MSEPSTEKPPGAQLTGWLASLVRSHNTGALAALRRPDPPIRTEAHFKAASFAPAEEDEPYYQFTAFLFARYHAGAATPRLGFGDMGAALRRVGNGATRGPENPGVKRLLTRITASREVPARHLQHAVDRARSHNSAPPAWDLLPEDLARWKQRGRPVADAWGRSFYTPNYSNRNSS
ncbi:type I-E CRISPR-associated protein Cse2/CasB [Streptomyces rubiginosohelvolus]|uniref:Type I-E CRISPR-associated protein Cse2/CasB n=1 Tax=Streptomyces rubiginosohelvolus TaxID=67362 RepID=A0ABW6F3L2_9ACTN